MSQSVSQSKTSDLMQNINDMAITATGNTSRYSFRLNLHWQE